MDRRGCLEGCGVLLFLSTSFSWDLSSAGVRNAILHCPSKLLARLKSPVHLCLLCSPGDNVYTCAHVRAAISREGLEHVSRAFSHPPSPPCLSQESAVFIVAVSGESWVGVVETLSFFMLTFDSRTSELTDWHRAQWGQGGGLRSRKLNCAGF